jgi:hypothetical protein
MTPIAEEFQSASLRIGFPQKYTEVSALGQKATCAYSWLTSASPSILLQKSFCTGGQKF